MLGYCPEPEHLDNAVRTVPNTQYEVGTNVTYKCDECHTGGGTSTCQCNRTWSHPLECASEFEVKNLHPIICLNTNMYKTFIAYHQVYKISLYEVNSYNILFILFISSVFNDLNR